MQGEQQGRVSRQVQQQYGLPTGFQTSSPFPFAGMNTQASRLAIGDPEGYWIENLIKLGDGNVRAVPDRGTALFARSAVEDRVIISFASFNIGDDDYFIVFFSDGSAFQVAYPSGAQTVVSPLASGTFYTEGGQLPATVQWGSLYLLIANNNTQNDYWAWDGEVLYTAGALAPQSTMTSVGTNYVVPPFIFVYGGHGSGVELEATIINGSIIALKVVNPGTGYVPGDQVQVQFIGGGSDTGARLESVLRTSSLNEIVMLAGGTGYATPPAVSFTGGSGTGALATATVSGGAVVSVLIDDPGTGYVTAPTVVFTGGGGTGAQATSTLVGVGVGSVTIVDGGTNFFGIPALTFRGGFGSGATATAVLGGPGPVALITVTVGGAGYTSLPTVTITDNGTGATAHVDSIISGEVISIVVDTGGAGYTAPPRVDITGDGFGARATAVLTADAVTSITVDSGGADYTTATVTIAGGTGSGATAVVTGVINGIITSIDLTNDGGTGYTDPQVDISGGGGAGAIATASIGAGGIVAVNIVHAGGGYTTAPGVFVQSGLNNAAGAVLELMPFGVSGTSLETYQSQVWVQNPFQIGPNPTGGNRLSSAPGSISDFATSDGGLSEISTDRFLRARLSAIRQSNSFLYPFGDSSVGVISNVQVQGNPATKTLTNQNTDPQLGTNWRDSIQDFSRTILFANPLGVYGLFGGAVTKVSSKMDGVFNRALFPTSLDPRAAGAPVTPSSAVATLYNQKLYLLLMTITDPFTMLTRNAMICWVDRGGRDQEWTMVSQTGVLTYIGTQEIDSNLKAWGTDGEALFPLLDTPSTTITKKWASKLYGAANPYITKMAYAFYVQAENLAEPGQAPLFNVLIDTEYATFPSGTTPLPVWPTGTLPASASVPAVQCPLLMCRAGQDIKAMQLGFTISSTDADFAIYNVLLSRTEDDGAISV